ncbi:actin patch protein 1 [Hypoxylon trugodes]|uniref:actin patch protein 1 n=1 Tax=Hypoxylon trugodes TaxID=326681 RepID=UPI002195FFEB|nr:actin patch protein 1 [Hypoxylon trugodes]KAI1393297.1 actin patch protein 1 [Hypoxylon trugodes]
MPEYGVGSGNYGADGGRERGARRRKLAAMAGSMYRAGATAVNEIRESYNQTRSREIDTPEVSKITIPGSFPDVAIVTKGNEQMVLFPSYAKRHVKGQLRQFENPGGPPHTSTIGMNEPAYWRNEWSRHEDEKAIVDVDIRGWIYNPHRGPMTRRNRILIGLARQLSGIPAPRPQQADSSPTAEPSLARIHQQHEEERERERIAREAKEIERRGRAEEEAAEKGGYSERPRDEDSEGEGNIRRRPSHPQSGSRSPPSAPSSPTLRGRTVTTGVTELTEAELAVANANLMARIAPFMTTPLVQIPITLFFYNEDQSQSRTVTTNDSGHFMIRAALDFIPTHVRVLANEDLSCTEPVQIIEPRGVSLISDIDDTIKRSNIALGAKEIFRNTFIRELHDLTVDGVKDWYNTLHGLGVSIHYCSNSPWQLYPVLATYFKMAGLPPGSLHLKQYTGMLQGIFEPVAERKKGTLEKIMSDFPERKFLLVGDSGEADLEVYTELAVANPGRIVAIFIRDVTTPEQTGYFDSGFDVRSNGTRTPKTNASLQHDQGSSRSSSANRNDTPSRRPTLPPRIASAPKPSEGPVMGDLIDLSEDVEPLRRVESESKALEKPTKPIDLLARKPPPPKPAKPSALQSTPAAPVLTTDDTGFTKKPPAPTPPQPRKASQASQPSNNNKAVTPSPLAQMQRLADQTGKNNSGDQIPLTKTQNNGSTPGPSTSARSLTILPPPPPPPRRRNTPSSNTVSTTRSSPRLTGARDSSTRNNTTSHSDTSLNRWRSTDSDTPSDFEALPPSAAGGMYGSSNNRYGNGYGSGSGSGGGTPPPLVNKKLDLWRHRLQRAQEVLDRHGVALYTWRRGDEVVDEAVGIVKRCLEEIGK